MQASIRERSAPLSEVETLRSSADDEAVLKFRSVTDRLTSLRSLIDDLESDSLNSSASPSSILTAEDLSKLDESVLRLGATIAWSKVCDDDILSQSYNQLNQPPNAAPFASDSNVLEMRKQTEQLRRQLQRRSDAIDLTVVSDEPIDDDFQLLNLPQPPDPMMQLEELRELIFMYPAADENGTESLSQSIAQPRIDSIFDLTATFTELLTTTTTAEPLQLHHQHQSALHDSPLQPLPDSTTNPTAAELSLQLWIDEHPTFLDSVLQASPEDSNISLGTTQELEQRSDSPDPPLDSSRTAAVLDSISNLQHSIDTVLKPEFIIQSIEATPASTLSPSSTVHSPSSSRTFTSSPSRSSTTDTPSASQAQHQPLRERLKFSGEELYSVTLRAHRKSELERQRLDNERRKFAADDHYSVRLQVVRLEERQRAYEQQQRAMRQRIEQVRQQQVEREREAERQRKSAYERSKFLAEDRYAQASRKRAKSLERRAQLHRCESNKFAAELQYAGSFSTWLAERERRALELAASQRAAALRIQRWYRLRVRWRVIRAIVLQQFSQWCSHQVIKARHRAATEIQRIWRAHVVRHRRPEMTALQAWRARRATAATVIQALWRGFRVRHRFSTLLGAAGAFEDDDDLPSFASLVQQPARPIFDESPSESTFQRTLASLKRAAEAAMVAPEPVEQRGTAFPAENGLVSGPVTPATVTVLPTPLFTTPVPPILPRIPVSPVMNSSTVVSQSLFTSVAPVRPQSPLVSTELRPTTPRHRPFQSYGHSISSDLQLRPVSAPSPDAPAHPLATPNSLPPLRASTPPTRPPAQLHPLSSTSSLNSQPSAAPTTSEGIPTESHLLALMQQKQRRMQKMKEKNRKLDPAERLERFQRIASHPQQPLHPSNAPQPMQPRQQSPLKPLPRPPIRPESADPESEPVLSPAAVRGQRSLSGMARFF